MIRASILNLECVDILRDSIGHPSKKLLLFEFDTSFRFQFGASRYITGLSRTSEKILSLFEFLGVSVFNLERLDILRDSIGLPS